MTVRTAAQIREELLEAARSTTSATTATQRRRAHRSRQPRAQLGAGRRRSATTATPASIAPRDRPVLERLRDTVILPPTDLSVREIESLQTILATRELGQPPSASAWQPQLAVERGYAFVASDGRLDVSRTGRELLRRL